METKDLSTLKPNPSNPRTISRTTFNNLKEGMKQFGDLSCIIMNRRSDQLIGGHQRIESFKAIMDGGQIVITEQLSEPNEVGTVATGYIQYGTERYKFRVVDWDETKATAAAISANHLHGDDDNLLLAEANYFLTQNAPDLLALTGQSEKEIEKLLQSVSGEEPQPDDTNQEPAEDEKWTFQLTPMQSDVIHAVIDRVKKENGLDYKDHGTALYYLCQEWLNTHKAEPVEPVIPTDRLDGIPTDNLG